MNDFMVFVENEDLDNVIDDILDDTYDPMTEASNARVIGKGIKDAASMTSTAFRAGQKIATAPFRIISLIRKVIGWIVNTYSGIKVDIKTQIYNKEGKVEESKIRAAWGRYVENTKVPGFTAILRNVQTFPVPDANDVVELGRSVKPYKKALDQLVNTAIDHPDTPKTEIPRFMPKPIIRIVNRKKAISDWAQNYNMYKESVLSIITCVNIFDDITVAINDTIKRIEAAYAPTKNESVMIKGYTKYFEADGDTQQNQSPPPAPPQTNTTQNTQQPQQPPTQDEKDQKPKQGKQMSKTLINTLNQMHKEVNRVYNISSPLMDVYWVLMKYTSIRDIEAFSKKMARLRPEPEPDKEEQNADQQNTQEQNAQQTEQEPAKN